MVSGYSPEKSSKGCFSKAGDGPWGAAFLQNSAMEQMGYCGEPFLDFVAVYSATPGTSCFQGRQGERAPASWASQQGYISAMGTSKG